mmetsp:Transcript_21492/g.50154  ORF Transcript_21492/g.50154 Transcript_21492/m.50154 type:complete len:169 (+) Transcript_21492:1202-1708(+)
MATTVPLKVSKKVSSQPTEAASRWLVGSSSSSTRGEQTMDMAIATRRFSPPETRCSADALPPSCVLAMCDRPRERSVESTAAERCALVASTGSVSCAANQTHSRGVSVSERLSSCRTYPTIAGSLTPCCGIAWPPTSTRPSRVAPGASTPATASSSVVLPEPDAPITP